MYRFRFQVGAGHDGILDRKLTETYRQCPVHGHCSRVLGAFRNWWTLSLSC